MTLDLTLSPLYRINGQEIASLPGLFVQTPPRNAVDRHFRFFHI
jgi:hypothetical protein